MDCDSKWIVILQSFLFKAARYCLSFNLHIFLWCKQRSLASVVVDQHVRPVLVAFSPELHSFIIPSYKQPYCFVWMHIWPWRHCILNTRKSIYVEWPIYVVHSSWNALQESGEQFGIHQAKNVVFFQIQVAFSALRHWVSDNRRVFFSCHRPCKWHWALAFFSCTTRHVCKHLCFLFFRHCRATARVSFTRNALINESSEVILLLATDRKFPLADHFNRKW